MRWFFLAAFLLGGYVSWKQRKELDTNYKIDNLWDYMWGEDPTKWP